DLVGLLVDLDVQVAGGAAAGADLAFAGEADAHAVLDARGHLDGDVPPRAHAALAAALAARVGDDAPVARAGRAGPGGADLAEDRALHDLDLARAAAGGARLRLGVALGAGPFAFVADDGGVDGDRRFGAEGDFFEVE